MNPGVAAAGTRGGDSPGGDRKASGPSDTSRLFVRQGLGAGN